MTTPQTTLNHADDRIDSIIEKVLEDDAIDPYRKVRWLEDQIGRAKQDILTIRANNGI